MIIKQGFTSRWKIQRFVAPDRSKMISLQDSAAVYDVPPLLFILPLVALLFLPLLDGKIENAKGNDEHGPKKRSSKDCSKVSRKTTSCKNSKVSSTKSHEHSPFLRITSSCFSMTDFFRSFYNIIWAKRFASRGNIQRFRLRRIGVKWFLMMCQSIFFFRR